MVETLKGVRLVWVVGIVVYVGCLCMMCMKGC